LHCEQVRKRLGVQIPAGPCIKSLNSFRFFQKHYASLLKKEKIRKGQPINFIGPPQHPGVALALLADEAVITLPHLVHLYFGIQSLTPYYKNKHIKVQSGTGPHFFSNFF